MKFESLYKIIKTRQVKFKSNSYTSSLFKNGLDSICQKIGEEATEVIVEAKNNNKKRIIEETADLFFHALIILAYFNITIKDIYDELESRKK